MTVIKVELDDEEHEQIKKWDKTFNDAVKVLEKKHTIFVPFDYRETEER